MANAIIEEQGNGLWLIWGINRLGFNRSGAAATLADAINNAAGFAFTTATVRFADGVTRETALIRD